MKTGRNICIGRILTSNLIPESVRSNLSVRSTVLSAMMYDGETTREARFLFKMARPISSADPARVFPAPIPAIKSLSRFLDE